MAKIMIPKSSGQETSMGRRLIGMAAPIVGGIYGGPAGAAAGGMLGAKITGQDTDQALMSGAQSGISQMAAGGQKPGAEPKGGMLPASNTGLNDNAFGRRMTAMQSNPDAVINEGLDALTVMPKDVREQYTKPLVEAQMMLRRNRGFNPTA